MNREELLKNAKPILQDEKCELVGQRFGKLIVVKKVGTKRVGIAQKPKSLWLCKCDCGNEKVVLRSSLITGNTKSCGCLELETKRAIHLKHGMAKTRLWNIWINMKSRCESTKNKDYKYYGGRGITVCEEWKAFESFMNWSFKNGYKDELTLDRIDNDAGYEPNNCRWATRKEQTRNRDITLKAEYNGENIPLGEIAELESIPYEKAYEKFIRNKNLNIEFERVVAE